MMAFPFILFNFIKSKWKSDLKLYEKTITKTKKKTKTETEYVKCSGNACSHRMCFDMFPMFLLMLVYVFFVLPVVKMPAAYLKCTLRASRICMWWLVIS